MSKPTFRIEPSSKNQFVVVRFDRTWWKDHRTVLIACDRLQEAEMHLCTALDREFMRELDRKHYTSAEYDVDSVHPRDEEEKIYTALVLAGHRPPAEHEPWDNTAKSDLLEQMLGKRLEFVERRLFEGRFMSWYAKENPDYRDPRRNMSYGEPGFSDPYNRRAIPAMPGTATGMRLLQDAATRGYRRLIDKLTGRTP